MPKKKTIKQDNVLNLCGICTGDLGEFRFRHPECAILFNKIKNILAILELKESEKKNIPTESYRVMHTDINLMASQISYLDKEINIQKEKLEKIEFKLEGGF